VDEPTPMLMLGQRLWHGLQVCLGSCLLTLTCFLVLPLLQAIAGTPNADLALTSLDTVEMPPPPPPIEEEPKPEQKPEEKPPELTESAPPLDLAQLELALNPGLGSGDGWLGADGAARLSAIGAGADGQVDALFSLADLDQKPRAVHQPSPTLTPEVRKRAPGTVHVLFIVDQNGRVDNPIVQSSSDPVFEPAALTAVKQWRFEPGKRNGQPVRFRMRVPITFPKG